MPDVRGRRVLLTGAAGFLGGNLTRELLRQGAEVHVLLRESTNPWRIAEVWRQLTVHRADLVEATTVQAAVASARPQVIFHLAMPSGHPYDREGRERMLRTIILGTAHVLEAAAVLGVARVVHLGSFLEYGPRGQPARETDPLEPVTPRGAAKAAASLWCQGFARASGLSAVVLRAFSVYGPWEDSGRLIATAVRAALESKPMPLTAAASRRDFVFVEDVVAACLLAARAEVSPGEVINVGTGVLSSNQEVVTAVEAVCGRRLEIGGQHPARPADASGCAADVEKARAVLGWQPRYSLRQGLEATVAWFRQRSGLPDSVRGDATAQAAAREAHGEP